ncbi:hypothetical protein HHL16_09660 [Pseudoflavitalea sp. G-6-1-2]|uniref:hypothetical protein n=1 Tax=Pseudoflavitalea sp. G-6-1-2 TaxID=2728841 RepID=UPI00146A4DB8|nr:hypothetical protein [Pseudoflavitalea sp. G-6-1-2]NML21140.1 hypothetical protein [Pseudoflavitalea sp. G-6-1-2]
MKEHQVDGAFHTAYLIIKHLKGELSEKELSDLHHWINSNAAHYDVFESLKDPLQTSEALAQIAGYPVAEAHMRLLRKIKED